LIKSLRSKGGSFKGIGKELEISPATSYKYGKDIELSEEAKNLLIHRTSRANKAARLKGAKTNKENAKRRHKNYKESGFEWAKKDYIFSLICSLYWAEGGKGKNKFSISNSDPGMLNLVSTWLNTTQYKDRWDFRCIYHPRNGFTEEQITDYWLGEIDYLSLDKIKKFTVSKQSDDRGKKIGKLPYGVGIITVCSTELRQMVEGGWGYLKSSHFIAKVDTPVE
jgi:hypothetical protein